MINVSPKKYSLEERTSVFGESVIDFAKKIKPTVISTPLISQFVRSGTSIGANYMEANNASSRKDFQHKIFICKKEAQETKYWLRMIIKNDKSLQNEAKILLAEVQELILIFQKIVSTMRQNV